MVILSWGLILANNNHLSRVKMLETPFLNGKINHNHMKLEVLIT